MGSRCPRGSQAKSHPIRAADPSLASELYLRAKPQQKWAFSTSLPFSPEYRTQGLNTSFQKCILALKFYYYGFYVLVSLTFFFFFHIITFLPSRGQGRAVCKLLQGLTFNMEDFIISVVINFKWQTAFCYVFIKQQTSWWRKMDSQLPSLRWPWQAGPDEKTEHPAQRNSRDIKARPLRRPVEL